MRLSTAPRALPVIVEDEDGVDVSCRALNDRQLVALLTGTGTVLGVAPQSTALARCEQRLLATLDAYRVGTLRPVSYWDDLDDLGEDHDRRLTPLRTALEQHGRWVVAGCAERPGTHGLESIAVVALIDEPHAACIVRVRLDEAAADQPAKAA